MKKIIIFFSFIIFTYFVSCADKNIKVVKVGYIGDSDRIIWEEVMKQVADDNIKIELISFGDYFLPNKALNDGEIDLNNFQHYAFFNSEIEAKGYKLTAIADTCLAAMNIYSKNIKNINEIKKGDKIVIPDDPSNRKRSLKVLEAAGLIKLNNVANNTLKDIAENKLNLEIIEVNAGSIYSLLPDTACAVINCNLAFNFGLDPDKDSIFKDNISNYPDKSYINIIAARTEEKDNEIYKKIIDAYQSEEVKNIYNNQFKEAYIAVW